MVIEILDMMMLVQGMSMDRVRCGAVKIYEQDVWGTPSSLTTSHNGCSCDSIPAATRLMDPHTNETMHEMMINCSGGTTASKV